MESILLKKILLYTFLVYTLMGFIALPLILKPQLIKTVEQELNAKISIESISFNPYIFKLVILDLKLTTLDKKELIKFESIALNIEPHSLLNMTLHIKEFLINKPEISLVYNRDKTFNILSIIKPSDTSTKENNTTTLMPRIKLDTIKITNGTLNYLDNTHDSKFDFSFTKIGFNLQDIDTNDFNSSDAKMRFYTQLGDGGFFDLKSNIRGFSPFVVDGSVDYEASKLYTQWRYIQDDLNLEVADGKLSFFAKYHFNLDDLNDTKIYDAFVKLNDLRIKPKSKYSDVLNLDSFNITGITVYPMLQEVEVAEVKMNDLSIKVQKDKNGTIDWLEYIKVNTANAQKVQDENITTEVNVEKTPWSVVVKNLSLEKIAVDFMDKEISPNVESRLNDMNFYAQNITLAGKKALTFELNTQINDVFNCSVKGNLIHTHLDMNADIECRDFDIVHYRPYIDKEATKALERYGVKLARATVDFDAKVNVKDIDEEFIVDVKDANLHLNNFALNRKNNNQRLIDFKVFSIRSVSLNTKNKTLDIDKIVLDTLKIDTRRYKSGRLNIENLVVAKKSKKQKNVEPKGTKNKQEYRVKLKHFAFNNGEVLFRDYSLEPSVTSRVDRVNFNAYEIDSKKESWLKYDFSTRVNRKGYIKSNGSLCHTPLKQKGKIELKKISLVELNPYIDEIAFVKLTDGYLSLKAKTEYAPSDRSADLKVNGWMKINDFFVNDTRDDKTLFSFNEFGFKSFTLEHAPNRLHVNEANLNSFYVDALINEKKEMNLGLLLKENKNDLTQEKKVDKKKTKNNFPVKITKLSINSGSAEFA